MTERIFKSMMNRLPYGEYNVKDLNGIYKIICPKSYKDTSKYKNKMRWLSFICMFNERKYGFEYMFNNKIRYIGTNDLDILIVDK